MMQDNPEGGKLGPAVDNRRRCKKNLFPVLACIDERTKEGCNRGSEIRTADCILSPTNGGHLLWWWVGIATI